MALLSSTFWKSEASMRTAKIILAGSAGITMLMSTALNDTRIDRLSDTVSIQQTPSGTVGANAGGATEQFKVQDGPLLETLHAGDKSELCGHRKCRREIDYHA
jgi:hypothetical protein